MELMQIIIIAFAIFVLTRIVLRLRDNQLTIIEFFLWIALWGGVLLVALIPSVATASAHLIGIGRGVDALIYIALLMLFYLMFRIIIKLDTIQKEMSLIEKGLKR